MVMDKHTQNNRTLIDNYVFGDVFKRQDGGINDKQYIYKYTCK